MPEGSEGSSSESGALGGGTGSAGRQMGSTGSRSRVSRAGYTSPMRSGPYGWNYDGPREAYSGESYRYANPSDVWRSNRVRSEDGRQYSANPSMRGNGGHDPYSMDRSTYGAPPPYGPQGYTQGEYAPQPVFIQPIFADLSGEKTEKEPAMSEVKNVFSMPAYAAAPAYTAPAYAAPVAAPVAAVGGFGGFGGDGGLLALAALSGGGLFGGRRDHDRNDCASTDQLQTATGSIIDAGQNTAIMGTLAGISAAIPLAEAQVQLALAGSTGEIRTHLGQVENGILIGQAGINKGISDAIAASLASQNNINVNVLTQGAATREAISNFGVANLNATKDAQFATGVAIANSTKEILAALNDQNTANLQRQLTVAEQALLEQRNDFRARGTEINVTQNVNQQQVQLQQQQQQQQQALLLDRLCQHVMGLQNAVATNSNLIIGNTGAVGTGPQTANPVNVRT